VRARASHAVQSIQHQLRCRLRRRAVDSRPRPVGAATRGEPAIAFLRHGGAIMKAQMLTMACAIISDVLVPSSTQVR
jgi:hypothetical protein